jgi:hypothetical protein
MRLTYCLEKHRVELPEPEPEPGTLAIPLPTQNANVLAAKALER